MQEIGKEVCEVQKTYKEIPRGLKKFLRPYLKQLTKPQQKHFSTLITGLIIHENKTLQEINDALSTKNQSSLNRFLNNHNLNALNDVRLSRVQRAFPTSQDGLLIIDDTLTHKTGTHMEGAGWHRSGVTKKTEWGHCILNSLYTHPNWKFGYPITADIYTNKENKNYTYQSKKQMALEQVKYARVRGVQGIICADSLFYADYVVHVLDDAQEKYLLGTASSLKISVARAPRKTLAEYFQHARFERVRIHGRWYHVSSVWASIRNVGVRRIICSFPEGHEDDNKKFYVSNLECSNKKLMRLLICRWRIESWHRDAKQHLGLEEYQVRKDRAVRNVVLAVLIAYTVLILSTLHSTLRHMAMHIGRALRTIGELCRFMQLAARKSWRWITHMLRDRLEEFKEILNLEVLVKNAKV